MTKWLKAIPTTREEHHEIKEHPLLHLCSGKDGSFGDFTIDSDPNMKADLCIDARQLPFKDNEFAAVFMDCPWTSAFKVQISDIMKEALRVAPIAYVICPWMWGNRISRLEWVKIVWQPGVTSPLLFCKYIRSEEAKE